MRELRVKVRFLVCLFLVVSIAQDVMHPAIAAPEETTAGRAIYERLCVSCHGADGQGGPMEGMLPVPPRNLTEQTYMRTKDDQQLFDVIQRGGANTGLSSAMPAFGAQLTDQEIRDTVAYVRTLGGQTATSDIPADSRAAAPQPPATDLRIASLRLSIWPEYDDPRVLIIFRGEIDAGTALPAPFSLSIPKGAEVIGAGMVSEQDQLLLLPRQVVAEASQDHLEMTLPVSRFFVEFYYDPFAVGTTKRFRYSLPITYAIERLEVEFQQPLQATNVSLDPQPMRQETDARGFTHYWFFYQDVKPGEPLDFAISYTRTVSAPSISRPQPEPTGVEQPRTAATSTAVAVGLLIGAALVLGGGAWLWKGYQRRSQARLTHQNPSPDAPVATGTIAVGPSTAAAADEVNFCFHCGRKLQPTHRFCPGCGKLLRPEPSG